MNTEKFLSAGELGDKLRVKAAIVRLWAREQKIPAIVLPNGRIVFDENEVLTTLRNRPPAAQDRPQDEGGRQ